MNTILTRIPMRSFLIFLFFIITSRIWHSTCKTCGLVSVPSITRTLFPRLYLAYCYFMLLFYWQLFWCWLLHWCPDYALFDILDIPIPLCLSPWLSYWCIHRHDISVSWVHTDRSWWTSFHTIPFIIDWISSVSTRTHEAHMERE